MNTSERYDLQLADAIAKKRLQCIRRVKELASGLNLNGSLKTETIAVELAAIAVEIRNLHVLIAERASFRLQGEASGDLSARKDQG